MGAPARFLAAAFADPSMQDSDSGEELDLGLMMVTLDGVERLIART